jgi:putative addiction module component (TIGR02574 family)
MTLDAIRQAAMSLSPEDRFQLAEELLSTVPADVPITDEVERLIEERVAAHERDPSAVCSLESVTEEIDRVLAAKRQR